MKIHSGSKLDIVTNEEKKFFSTNVDSFFTSIESQLAEIWSEVLKKRHIQRDDNFFELGGDSIRAAQVIARIQVCFHIEFSIQKFFSAPILKDAAAAIAELLQENKTDSLLTIGSISRGQVHQLSFSQERIWFLHQLNPTSSAYNTNCVVHFEGKLDIAALKRSFQKLAMRHESMRTTFPVIKGQPYLKISPPTIITLKQVDLRKISAEEREIETLKRITDEAALPFDVEHGPLTQFVLFITGEQKYSLLLSMHHLVVDAWGMMIILQDLSILYNHAINPTSPDLSALNIGYVDYSAWHRNWFQGEIRESHVAYWRKQLANLTPLNLPTDKIRPVIQTYAGIIISRPLDEQLFSRLQQLALQEGATPFMIGLAAYLLFLSRYTAQTDIAVGVPFANRDQLQSELLIGTLVNTLVMRVELSGNPTFRELIRRVREAVLEAYAFHNMPFEQLVAEINPVRDTAYNPLVQVLFNMINVPTPETFMNDLKLNSLLVGVERRSSQFDLQFTIVDVPGFRRLDAEFNTDLFEPETIERMLDQYQQLLDSLTEYFDQPIESIPLLIESERQRLLVEWNSTEMPLPAELELVKLIRSQALKNPDACAVIAKDKTLSYQELVQRIDVLAGAMHQQGIQPGDRVGIGLQRTSDLVVAPLAIMAIGATYVPLDPGFPDNRLEWIIEDAGLSLILTHRSEVQRWPREIGQIVLENEAFWTDSVPAEIPTHELDDMRLAYILYTSGSTGKPKGVAVRQRSLVNFLCSMTREPGIQASDVLLGVTTISFDIAGLELYLPLMNGAKLVLASAAETHDGYLLKDLLSRHHVTILQATPATWRMLLDAGWGGKSDLRAFCGGEALSSDLACDLLARVAELWNLYGPTETTIWSTIMRINKNSLKYGSPPIGRPIANTQVYILDSRRELVPQGVLGELYIGGAGVADGYYGRLDLTTQRFVPDPFRGSEKTLIYRTGDVVRWGADGFLHYMGRSDNQVKIRGYRIELGEIENVINQNPRIKQSVVVPQGGPAEQLRLVAYYEPVAASSRDGLRTELETNAHAQLPEYMVPTLFIELDKLPLTPNGKIDRKALPAPNQIENVANQPTYAPPQTPIEIELAKIWSDLLEVNQVGLQDNFFALGGFSLLSVRMVAEIEKHFGKKLPISVLINFPTLGELADFIENKDSRILPFQKASPLVPIKTNRCKAPLFLVHSNGGGVFGFRMLAQYLDEDQPVFGLEARPAAALDPEMSHIETMAAKYIKAIQEVQPQGPYYLGGYSFGGSVAYEMAYQLREQGHSIGLLAMLDCEAPNSGYDHPRLTLTFIKGFLNNLSVWWKDFWQLTPAVRKGRIRRKLFLVKKMDPKTGGINLEAFEDDISRMPPDYRELKKKLIQAYEDYRPRTYAGRVAVFQAPRRPLFCSYDSHMEWDRLAKGGVDMYPVKGGHLSMLEEPHVEVLAKALKQALEQSQAGN